MKYSPIEISRHNLLISLTSRVILFSCLIPHLFEIYFSSLSYSNCHFYNNSGIATMALYVTFVMIILLNLIIARMSSTHEKINDKSFEQWSMVMAKNVQDCLLINEKVSVHIFYSVLLLLLLLTIFFTTLVSIFMIFTFLLQ